MVSTLFAEMIAVDADAAAVVEQFYIRGTALVLILQQIDILWVC